MFVTQRVENFLLFDPEEKSSSEKALSSTPTGDEEFRFSLSSAITKQCKENIWRQLSTSTIEFWPPSVPEQGVEKHRGGMQLRNSRQSSSLLEKTSNTAAMAMVEESNWWLSGTSKIFPIRISVALNR